MSEKESSLIVKNNHSSNYGATNRRNSNDIANHIADQETDPLIQSTTSAQSVTDQMLSTISIGSKIGFALGHIYNDLCAGVWFSYLLLFMKGALRMPGTVAGSLMMLGQVGDALATPVVGYLVDKYSTKQRWHIFGTILVFVTFPMIFSICPMCDEWPSWWQTVYFSIVILLFQFGWPTVQVTHLAIIPEMARTQKDRSQLTSVQYSASVISNVIVFIVTWLVLRSNRSSTIRAQIGPKDAYRFRDISLILSLIGLCMVAIFQFSLTFGGYGLRRWQALQYNRSVSTVSNEQPNESSDTERQPIISNRPREHRRKNFLIMPVFYQHSLLYVFSRLFMTTSLVYIPLWLDDRMYHVPKDLSDDNNVEHLATVPMVSFISSFVSSLLMNKSHHHIGHKSLYLIGSIVSVCGCVLVETASSSNVTNIRLYSIATLFGAGSSITMISSLCLIANMIGKHAEQSGFVYSIVTFADKLITGVAVLFIESLKCKDSKQCPDYYKNVLSRTCGGAAILGVLILLTLLFNQRRRTAQS